MTKTLLVTGGSRGIGAAISILAARKGYDVAVNYFQNKNSASGVVSRIQDIGGKAIAVQADIADENQVVQMFEQTDRELGQLAALVNNAGILAPLSRVENYDVERIRRIFDVNVIGAFLCAQQAIFRMSAQHGGQGGSIINISSGAARLGAANDYIDYAASKGAIDTFTIGLAKELAPDRIRVNAVRAGFIDTDMHQSVGGDERFEALRHTIVMQRRGRPEEIAQAVLWLLSDQASYCTGTILDVTGGR